MDNVIGREAQKSKLKAILQSKSPEFVVVLGRRRVGKTFLIREYYGAHMAFDMTGAYEQSTEYQLDNFFSIYLKCTKGQLETTKPTTWNEAFRYLAKYLQSLDKRKKHVVFIDELPWLDVHKSGVLSALEYFWNQEVSRMNHIVLVVCGSSNSWMNKKLLKAKGGLYNRVTRRIFLSPFNLYETDLFLKSRNINLSQAQVIELYMALGGIPHYLKEVGRGQSVPQIIDALCFDKMGALKGEFNLLYPSIFNKAENHMAIIAALAGKPNGMVRADLMKSSDLSDGGVFTRTKDELVEAGFIYEINPFGRKKRDSIYKLVDMYSLFYFKFIKNNNNKGKGTWQKLSESPSYKAWSGYAYENICLLHIDQIKLALGISGVYTDTSSWKSLGDKENDIDGGQIDLIIDRNDQVINLCEVKFTKEEFTINKTYAAVLRKRRALFKNTTGTKKNIFNTLITTYAAHKNEYYLEEIDAEITMEALFRNP